MDKETLLRKMRLSKKQEKVSTLSNLCILDSMVRMYTIMCLILKIDKYSILKARTTMCGLDFYEDFLPIPIQTCHIRRKETIDWRWPSDSWMDFDGLCSRPSPYRAIRAWEQCTTSSAHSSILSEDWQVLTQPIGPIGNHHITSPTAASCNQLNQLT